MDPRVLCIGHATLDAIVRVDRLPGPDERRPVREGRLAGGGPAATAAVTLARLGVPVALAGRVGEDTAGRWIRDDLQAACVHVRHLERGGRSPFTVVIVDADGRRSLLPVDADSPPRAGGTPPDADLVATARAASWIHVDHVGAQWLADLRAAGVDTPVSVDGGNPIADLSLEGVALYAPTERRLLDRYPGRSVTDALRAALDEGPHLVVVTRAEHGAVGAERAPDGSIAIHEAPPFASDIVSTLGAGDVFHGALLAALVEERPLAEALRWANAAAALACRGLDGRSMIPSRDQLEEALRSVPA